MPETTDHKHQGHNFPTQIDQPRNNYLIAYLILAVSLLVFWATVSGVTKSVSDLVKNILITNLGYTNKWSKSYGPAWFIYINDDISALAGPILLPIFILLISIYYHLKQRHRELRKIVFVVTGGIIFMMMSKVIFATDLSDRSVDIIYNSISPFPSGHAMLGTIFYISLGVTISRTQRRQNVRKFLLISSLLIIILIGFSRFLTGTHSLTEVLAGWSLGTIWLTTCWLLEQFTRKKGWS